MAEFRYDHLVPECVGDASELQDVCKEFEFHMKHSTALYGGYLRAEALGGTELEKLKYGVVLLSRSYNALLDYKVQQALSGQTSIVIGSQD